MLRLTLCIILALAVAIPATRAALHVADALKARGALLTAME